MGRTFIIIYVIYIADQQPVHLLVLPNHYPAEFFSDLSLRKLPEYSLFLLFSTDFIQTGTCNDVSKDRLKGKFFSYASSLYYDFNFVRCKRSG